MYKKLLAISIFIVLCLVSWRIYVNYTAFDKLVQAPHFQYVGAQDPSVIITEVMDYRCSACRQTHPAMAALVARHPEIRVIYRVYPIFGDPSIREAKMAMAAGMQGKFEGMHNLLITRDEPVTAADEQRMVAALALDHDQYMKDKLSWSATQDLLSGSAALEAIGVRSTPTLIVGRKIYRPKESLPTVTDLEALLAEHLRPPVVARDAAP